MDIGDIKYLKAPAKVLKLSEAIRIGSKIRPQCSRFFFAKGASCAVGAAMEASGVPFGALFGLSEAERCFPVLRELGTSVYEMNDAGVPREQIADLLEARGY